MIVITGSVVARPETLSELRRMAVEHSRRSRGEPGCLSHAVHVDCEDPHRLVFVERWADAASVKAHFAVPASGAFVQAAARLAAGPPTLEIYDATERNVRDVMA